jgi:TonB family protein
VVLEVVILSEGKVGAIRVLQGLPEGLTAKAIECVRDWEFTPATIEGRAVDIVAEIEVAFAIYESP